MRSLAFCSPSLATSRCSSHSNSHLLLRARCADPIVNVSLANIYDEAREYGAVRKRRVILQLQRPNVALELSATVSSVQIGFE